MSSFMTQKAPPHSLHGVSVSGLTAAAALVADATPKILAELYITEKLASSLASDAERISYMDIAPVRGHFEALRHELRSLIRDEASQAELFCPLISGLDMLVENACSYGPRWNDWKISDLRRFCADGRKVLCDMSLNGPSRTQRPLAPGLQLLEFDTEFSGVVDEVVNEVVALEKCFLIDPKLRIPQNGFGRVEDATEIRAALSLCESRLFATVKDGEMNGFFINENNQAALRETRGEIIRELESRGVIKKDAKLSFIRILGLRHAASKMSVKAGNDLYAQLMEAFSFSCRGDGITHAIALVREGVNSNTAIISHQRVGMIVTDIVINVSTGHGGTPYRVLLWPVSDPSLDISYPAIGHGSRFAKYDGHFSVKREIPEDSPSIWNSQAVKLWKDYFAKNYPWCDLSSWFGDYGLALQLTCAGRMCTLRQLRPRTDAWQLETLDTAKGKLEELLPLSCRWMLYGE
jgi:hypothetical protein